MDFQTGGGFFQFQHNGGSQTGSDGQCASKLQNGSLPLVQHQFFHFCEPVHKFPGLREQKRSTVSQV